MIKNNIDVPVSSMEQRGIVVPKVIKRTTKKYGDKDIEEFKKILIEKRDRNQNLIINLRKSIISYSETKVVIFGNHAENGTDEEILLKNSYELGRASKFLSQINKALNRIEEGTYGICSCCGDKIPKERLLAVPVTGQCVTCKCNKKTALNF